MADNEILKIALVGTPNSGKTTLFNQLTGLNQKVGNYAGVTVEKKSGFFNVKNKKYELIDLPGTYNLFANSQDEQIVSEILLDKENEDFPDLIILNSNALELKQGLFLLSQVKELGIDCILSINQVNKAEKKGFKINSKQIEKDFGISCIEVSSKSSKEVEKLKEKIYDSDYKPSAGDSKLYETEKLIERLTEFNLDIESYSLNNLLDYYKYKKDNYAKIRIKDSILRHQKIKNLYSNIVTKEESNRKDFSYKLDKVLIHPIFGFLIFFSLLFIIFQAVFLLGNQAGDWFENAEIFLSDIVQNNMPESVFRDFLTDGLISGVSAVLVFVPQIALLFLFISLMEQSGYMNRVIYLMDKFMRPFGMSGKSVVPLISSAACAIPAVMASRSIENPREKLITILTAPFITCSARLPVYSTLIALVIPDEGYKQGFVLFLMYILGIFTALISGWILKSRIKTKYKSYLIFDLADYTIPDFKTTFIEIWINVKKFIWDAGKVIVFVVIILFILQNNGGEKFYNAEKYINTNYSELDAKEKELYIKSYQQENSYLGIMGKAIEPAIKPLGYDWKIGIGLISSIAAREVFISSMAVIYNSEESDKVKLRSRMKNAKNRNTGKATFNFATGMSLMIFYAFALQCISTIAVVRKETKSYKWALIQFVFMTSLAYLLAFLTYQILK